MLQPDLPEISIPLGPDNFLNRELTWLDFNERVLVEAQDANNPLLERLKFLAIFSNNLDEFFMVRVGSYQEKFKAGVGTNRPDGLEPSELLHAIRDRVNDLIATHRRTKREVLSALAEQNIVIVSLKDLPDHQRAALRTYYEQEVFPVLTPLAVDRTRPFPFISNLSLNLAVWLERPDSDEVPEFVRVKIPQNVLPRLLRIDDILGTEEGRYTFIYLENLIIENLDMLFPGMNVLEAVPFRITRNADIDYEYEQDTDEAHDFSALVEESLRERRFGAVVRLTVPRDMSEHTLNYLLDGLVVDIDRDVFVVDGTLGDMSLFEVYNLVKRPDLRYPPYIPRVPAIFTTSANIFEAIRQQDILVHHPYDSFGPVEEFFRTAAQDPNVLAIKTTLYRVGANSPVVQALMDARDNDKQVTALVELKARFDEENNLGWARAMEEKGIHVMYGVEELPVKTHAKIGLVVRKEGNSVRRYLHLGTGNYNASTARLYTDMGLFTCNDELAHDVSLLFNRLTGYAPATTYRRMLVAPEYLLSGLLDLIDNEIAAAQAGRPARLIFKMNQLEEDIMVAKLYEASQAGVQVDLIVRGFSCLRPGVPGLSENIRVVSIIGRFLEHSRAYYFQNAPPDQRVYMGSADLMRRNLHNRVEQVVPVLDPALQVMIFRLLMTNLHDNVGAWEMLPDGSYRRVERQPGQPAISSQQVCMQHDSFGFTLDELRRLV